MDEEELSPQTIKNRELYESSLKHRLIPNVVGGGISGVITDFLLFPFETIKTRFQASRQFVMASFYQKVYNGLRPQLIMSFPNAALYFTGYECTKYIMDSDMVPYQLNMTQKAIVGGIVAEFFQMMVSNPFEIVKQQMQVGQEKYLMEAFKNNMKNGGFWNLYRGWASMLGREIPFSCLQFTIYEVSTLFFQIFKTEHS